MQSPNAREGIFLTIHDTLAQRQIQLIGVHRDRLRTEGLEGFDAVCVTWDPYLDALEVGGRDDRTNVVADLAETQRADPDQHDPLRQYGLRKIVLDGGNCSLGFVTVSEHERRIEDSKFRCDTLKPASVHRH